MINKYKLEARIFPAIISILPILVFSHFYLYKIIPELLDSILLTKIIGDISIFSIFIFIIVQLSRFISKKFLQDNLFKDELHFPTTEFLLYSNKSYTEIKKKQIREKIKNDFNIKLLTEKDEINNEVEARKTIKEAVDLIRSKVKDGRLLLQHNIEYGFIRNLIGGTIIAIPFSIFNTHFFFYQNNNTGFVISTILLIFYMFVDIFHKKILIYYANNYAKVLFNEYLIKK